MNVSAKDCAAFIIWEMASIWPKILPGAWAGIVPPITFSNRHVLLEDYMEKNQWCPLKQGNQVLDMGCGFPPLTAIDLAKRFPKVNIIGADRSFGKVHRYRYIRELCLYSWKMAVWNTCNRR